jgi:hypothetical protein
MPASGHSWSAVQCPHCSGQMKTGDCEAALSPPVGEAQPYIKVTEEEESMAREEWKHRRRSGKLAVAGGVFMLVAGAMVAWMAWRGGAPTAGQARVGAMQKAEGEQSDDEWRQVRAVVEKFLTVRQWRDLLPTVADPVRVEGVMTWYYSRNEWKPMEGAVKIPDYQRLEADGAELLRVRAEGGGERSLWLLLVRDHGEWKVDWEVFVNAGVVRWEAFLREPAGTMVELPLFAAKKPAADGYLVKAGATPDTHEALLLWAKKRQTLASAVLAKEAAVWQDLEGIGYDKAVKVIARLKMDNPGADPPLVKLEGIVQRGWVRPR